MVKKVRDTIRAYMPQPVIPHELEEYGIRGSRVDSIYLGIIEQKYYQTSSRLRPYLVYVFLYK